MERAVPTTPEGFNRQVAGLLRETADLLENQGANPFRVNAYRRAARTIEQLDVDVREVLRQEGREGLQKLPFIGRGLSAAVEEIAGSGTHAQLERLRGTVSPEQLFRSVPGIGPVLAERIHDDLSIDTLEALEVAAHDGRLESVPGVGRRRAAAIRASLAEQLGMRRSRRAAGLSPDVADVLAVDAEYRRGAAEGKLTRIAPRRFNPRHEAWLPVLHTERGDWHYTALFSNTARAHELGRTSDWVVVYFYDGEHDEGQHTVVTETAGPLEGRRVVRGREAECAEFYSSGSSIEG
jgi:putative hydrolase